jgi:ribose transport system substrate-binding protein
MTKGGGRARVDGGERRRALACVVAAAFALLACEGGKGTSAAGSAAPSGAPRKAKIAVIPKGTTHEFWKSVHAGAVKASRELGVEIVWKGPLKEDDLKQQIDLVQSFVAQRVDGVVLAPLNDKALVASVRDAVRARVPVVVIDSGLEGEAHASFVATDNHAAGKLAGERMAKLLAPSDPSAASDKAGVVVLRYQEGSASTAARERGFLEAARAAPHLDVLSDNQYGGATTESAHAASESLLLAQRAAEGKVKGVFCPNESTTFGMLLALRKAGLGGKIKFIGFDASDKLVQGLEAGEIHGLVLQDPLRMGYLGVKTMVEHLRGRAIERRIDTGAALVDAANMKEPEMKRLLAPDLSEWLGK